MGLVRKANVDTDTQSPAAAGDPGPVDMSTIIRQSVAAEIERQRLAKLQAEAERDADIPEGA